MGGKSSKYKKNLSKAEDSYSTSNKSLVHQFDNSTLQSFELFGTLGEGTFGRVRLARHKKVSDVPVAIKILKKKAAVEMKQVQHLKNEKAILESVQHPGIIQLFSTFQDSSHVFMILAYISGGEMFKYLRDEGQFSVPRTRIYAAEIFLALEYLHRNNIIYRDLKPENLLITQSGHMIVTDFGFAKVLKPGTRTYTTCGTPDYLAPEIIRSKGHGKPVDWWAFGVLVYEMATGFPPFYHDSVIEIYKMIIKGKMGAWPKRLAKKERPMRAFVRQLLSVDITKRLGA
jgi:protein kinase X